MNVQRLAVAAFVSLCSACGQPANMGPDGGTAACQVSYSGNVAASASSSDTCATLTTAADGGPNDGVTLGMVFRAMTAQSVQLEVKINLGATPTSGDITSENVHQWSAVGLNAQNNCLYSAGSASVPPGNFTMTLSTLTDTQAHGTLHVEQYVQAPPAVDCGPGDVETVDVTF